MPDHKTIIEENTKERARLKELMARLSDKDFNKVLPNGWTVAVALVHLAFWDQRQVTLLKRWKDQGVPPSSLDAEAVNAPLAVISQAISPTASVKLVLEAAEAIDREIEMLSPLQVEELLKMGLERNLRRALHRQNHLGKIEKALAL